MRDRVFIIGGGASLKGFDFNKLKNEDTIAVNVSALDVPNPTFSITADSSIFRKIQEGYFKNVKTTWVLVTNPNHCAMKWKDGKFIHVRSGFVYNLFCVDMIIKSTGLDGIGFSFNNFKTGYNSGFCALQLAVLLGYQEIYLLGIDLNNKAEESHYHNRYGGNKTISKTSFSNFYKSFVTALEEIKLKTKIKVSSMSSISSLNSCIPYKSWEEIL